MSIKLQPQQENERKPGRKFRIRSLRTQLIKCFGEARVRTVDKNEECIVDREIKDYLCGTGGVAGGFTLAVLIGEVD